MTITKPIQRQLFDETDTHQIQVIRIGQRRYARRSRTSNAAASHVGGRFVTGTWTTEEHELFLEGLDLHQSGPWKLIARHVGSRTPRQVMTHAQKYRMRIGRRARARREAASVSPSVPALPSTTEMTEPCGADANETAANVVAPQTTVVLSVDPSTPVAEGATHGEMQVSSPSVRSPLGQTPLDDANECGDLGWGFLTALMDDDRFGVIGMDTFVYGDDSEPLQF